MISAWFSPARERRRARALRRLYSDFVSAGDTVFDVGANRGDRTALFVALDARVIALEPQDSCVGELRSRFASESRVIVEPVALGAADGEAELAVSTQANTISTFSPKWLEGRFADQYEWDATETVRMTTLDAMLQRHGVPAFCKIDVEGFELQVLAGLSGPIPALSFEWVSEDLESAAACMRRVAAIGDYEFTWTKGEDTTLRTAWADADTVYSRLQEVPGDGWGDVYARLPGTHQTARRHRRPIRRMLRRWRS